MPHRPLRTTSCSQVSRSAARIALAFPAALFLLVAGFDTAGAMTFSQDFNSVRLPQATDQVFPHPGWSIQVDGRIWYDVAFSDQGPDSSVCLVLRASTVDPGMTDAAVRLRLDLRGPEPDQRYLVESEAVLQWDWWIRDNRFSEAVGVRLIYRRGDVLESREHWNTPFYSPSDGFDPVLVWDCHRLDLDDLHTPCEDPDQECIELEALEIELRGPVSQEVRLDNLYLGPRLGVEDCDQARTPGFVIMKLQSYSASFADLNRDGRWDVLMPGFLGRPAELWLGRDPEPAARAAGHGLDRYLGDLCLFLDVDNDGDQDLALVRVECSGLEILENRGHGRFAAEARHYPTSNLPVSVTAMTAGDIDGDGWIDIYIAVNGDLDVLMLGDGRGGFRQAAADRAVTLSERRVSGGSLMSDVDGDGDQDLLVAGSGLLRNDGRGHFTAESLDIARDRRSMIEGLNVGDLDQDTAWDLYLGIDQDSCRRPYSGRNLLFWGDPDAAGSWRRDRRSNTAVADAGHCEGSAVADFDNDGYLDLFIGNRSGPSLCLLGTGGGEFRPDRGEVFGSMEITDLYGLCAVDRDNDGDLDIFVVRKHSEPMYLENRTERRTYLTADLLGVAGNWDALGARAVVTGDQDDGFVALREVRAGNGYQLGGPRRLHFGVPGPGPYRLTVTFPSGLTVIRDGLEPGDHAVVVETTNPLAAAWHRLRRISWPAWSAGAARWPLPVQNVLLALLTLAVVLAWSPTLRRWRLGQKRPVRLLPALMVLAVLLVAVRHHVGWHRLDAWGLAVSLPIGAVIGATLPSAVRYLRRHRTPLSVWDRLNEEFISYTHTGWCKNLETLVRQGGMLSGDLSPADRDALEERWQAAHEHFYGAVMPKLDTIAELGSLLEATRPVGKDLAAGLRRMARARRAGPEEIAAGARELRQTADRLAALVEARLSCQVDDAMRTAWRAMIPELEERGVAGELDTAAVDGLRVRIREHELVMILQDLLRNAVEAAADGPRAAVSLTATADLRRVFVLLRDTGSGLAGQDPDQLCQAGFTTKKGGSGYGLFHARKTLGIYRATLALADRPEGGLDVTINLMRPLHARGDQTGATS